MIAEEAQAGPPLRGDELLQEQSPERRESTRTGRKKPGRQDTQR